MHGNMQCHIIKEMSNSKETKNIVGKIGIDSNKLEILKYFPPI
jgi:hypothetical protein